MYSAFAALCAHYNVLPARNGWADAPCPSCGHRVVKGQRHFAFNERFGHCFACGVTIGTARLARQVGAGEVAPTALPRREPPKPRHWQADPYRYVRAFTAALDRVSAWTAYRPLTLESIARWELGVGVLPSSKCAHRRLVVPIRKARKVVAFAGRAFCCPPDCESAKWLLSGGSEFALFNLDGVTAGCTVIVVENRADAILACQEWPEYVTVAKGSANVWRPEWTARFLEVRPALTLFWPDNDAAGYEGAARGANELLTAGLRAQVMRWAPAYPPKYDLGSFLADLMTESRCA